MNNEQSESVLQMVASLFRQGYSTDEITQQLRQKGVKDNLLQQALDEVQKLRLTKKRNAGFLWCGIGSFLLVSGCMLTFIQFSNGQNIRFVMYSLTSIGVIAILKGLIDLCGW
jgi:RecX family